MICAGNHFGNSSPIGKQIPLNDDGIAQVGANFVIDGPSIPRARRLIPPPHGLFLGKFRPVEQPDGYSGTGEGPGGRRAGGTGSDDENCHHFRLMRFARS
jgi:hypothetical protein